MSTFVADRDIRGSEKDRESLRDEVTRRVDQRTASGAIRPDLLPDIHRCVHCSNDRHDV